MNDEKNVITNILSQIGMVVRYILAFSLMTIVFGSAFYLAWVSRPADAALMAGLFVLLIIAFNFPGIESFKAFGLEVRRVQETLKEAQATLNQLKQLALSSAHNQFYQLSAAGRWGAGALAPKEKLARDLNKFLTEIDIDKKQIIEARQPYIDMIRADLFNVMRDLVTISYREAVQPVLDRANAIKPRSVDGINMYEQDRKPILDEAEEIGSVLRFLGNEVPSEAHFSNVMQAQIFRAKFGEPLAESLLALGSHLTRLYEAAKAEGNLTDEGLAFLREFGNAHTESTMQALRNSRYVAR